MIFLRNRLLGNAALVLMLMAGCSGPSEIVHTPASIQSQNTLAPALTPTIVPTPTMIPIEMRVPYDDASVWNTPIGPSPQYDVHSEEMIATLARSNDGNFITAGPAYNFPVYFADEQTPRWDVPCLINKCSIALSDQEILRTDIVKDIPIPLGAQPGEGSDARIIVIDKVTHTEYDLSKAQRTEDGWTAGTVSIYNIQWNGTPVGHSSRGSGIPAMAGLLRPWEIRQGRIEHALAFGYTETARECVFPASKSDGRSKLPFAIPEGARLQLDPTLTDADFEQMGLDATGKIIARALQEYGMILVDTSGALKIYVEDLENNPFATEQWTDPELNLTKESIYNIPHEAFHVLELPPGYWDESTTSTYHGKCLTFPQAP